MKFSSLVLVAASLIPLNSCSDSEIGSQALEDQKKTTHFLKEAKPLASDIAIQGGSFTHPMYQIGGKSYKSRHIYLSKNGGMSYADENGTIRVIGELEGGLVIATNDASRYLSDKKERDARAMADLIRIIVSRDLLKLKGASEFVKKQTGKVMDLETLKILVKTPEAFENSGCSPDGKTCFYMHKDKEYEFGNVLKEIATIPENGGSQASEGSSDQSNSGSSSDGVAGSCEVTIYFASFHCPPCEKLKTILPSAQPTLEGLGVKFNKITGSSPTGRFPSMFVNGQQLSAPWNKTSATLIADVKRICSL